MSTPCEKHALLPVVGQSPCAGCEIERLKDIVKSQAGRIVILRDRLNVSQGQIDTLAEWYANSLNECEALRQDSKRWKWLEGKADSATWENIGHQEQMNRHLHVDAAMSKDPLANPGQ